MERNLMPPFVAKMSWATGGGTHVGEPQMAADPWSIYCVFARNISPSSESCVAGIQWTVAMSSRLKTLNWSRNCWQISVLILTVCVVFGRTMQKFFCCPSFQKHSKARYQFCNVSSQCMLVTFIATCRVQSRDGGMLRISFTGSGKHVPSLPVCVPTKR